MEIYIIYILLCVGLCIFIGIPIGVYCWNCYYNRKITNSDKKYILDKSLLVNRY